MEEILKDTSSESVILAIEKNLHDFYIKSSKHPNFTSNIEDKISWIMAKSATWPSIIFRANFENLDVEYEIKNVIKQIQEGKAPNGWTIGPMTRPKDLGSILERNGFLAVYHQAGMTVDLTNIKDQTADIENFIVKIVDNEEALKQWGKTVSLVFNLKIDFELLNYLLSKEEPRFYTGISDGKVVSTLMLYLSSGVAGVHAVTTLPEFRSRGFALAISRTALIDAYELGYRVGVLKASKMGERVYRKLGFEKYCDVISYALNENI